MQWFNDSELPCKVLGDGITVRAAYGEHAMLTIFELEEGAVIPLHSHHHEQISYVIAGELAFTANGETRVLKAGEGCVVAADEQHTVTVLKGPAKAVDAWSPMREDYRLTE